MSSLHRKHRTATVVSPLIELPGAEDPLVDERPYYHIDRPQTPQEPPPKPIADQGTQINQRDWLLFDFEVEVRPVIEVLSARVLDSAKAELIAENELRVRREKERRREFRREANLQILQQAQENKIRWEEERAKRERQTLLVARVRESAHRKLFARTISKDLFVPQICNPSVDSLHAHRLLCDPETTAVEPLREGFLGLASGLVEKAGRVRELASGCVRGVSDRLKKLHLEGIERRRKMENDKLEQAEVARRLREKFLAEKREMKRQRRLSEAKQAVFDGVFKSHVEGGRAVKPAYVHHERIASPADWSEREQQGFGVYLDFFQSFVATLSRVEGAAERLEAAKRALLERPDFGVPASEALAGFFSGLPEALAERPAEELRAGLAALVAEFLEGSPYLRFLGDSGALQPPAVLAVFEALFDLAAMEEPQPAPGLVPAADAFGAFLQATQLLLRVNRPLNMNPAEGVGEALLTELADREYVYQFDGAIRALRRRVYGDSPEDPAIKTVTLGGRVFAEVRPVQEELLARARALCFAEDDPRRQLQPPLLDAIEDRLIELLRKETSELLVFDFYA